MLDGFAFCCAAHRDHAAALAAVEDNDVDGADELGQIEPKLIVSAITNALRKSHSTAEMRLGASPRKLAHKQEPLPLHRNLSAGMRGRLYAATKLEGGASSLRRTGRFMVQASVVSAV